MLYDFSLFILCGASDVWLDLRMPPRALSRKVSCRVMEMVNFASSCSSGTARADIISDADVVHAHGRLSGRLTEQLASLEWNWSSHAQAKLSHWETVYHTYTAHFQTSPSHLPFLLSFSLDSRTPIFHTHICAHTQTTLIWLHHPFFYSFSHDSFHHLLLQSGGCMTVNLLQRHSSPLLCFIHFDLYYSKLELLQLRLSFISQRRRNQEKKWLQWAWTGPFEPTQWRVSG